jgi:multicomponent Na+:H+ antiporter subunit D
MSPEASLLGLVFAPLLGACALVVSPARVRGAWVALALLAPPALLLAPTAALWEGGGAPIEIALAGHATPLGIRLHLDPLALVMLWLVAIAGGLAGVHAAAAEPPRSPGGGRFWPLWLLMLAGLNGLFLSGDLFNLYIAIELTTLVAVALVAWSGSAGALRAAMRYLLLGLLASVAYLLGVALLYGAHGALDLQLLAERAGSGDPATRTALALISGALLLKGAVFPLHIWLPAAHSRAPGAVSAVLSALVVKAALYLLYRLWLPPGESVGLDRGALLFGSLGACAILYGSVAALVQQRIKPMVAYSTVAQVGYLLLVFPLSLTPAAGALAWKGAVYHALCHGLAKAGMFLAAANLLRSLGSDRLRDLAGADRKRPLSVFAFALAGAGMIGLPPSGGFLAKWLLLEAAWSRQAWIWAAVLVLGSLLAAIYVFRALAAMFVRGGAAEQAERAAAQLQRSMELAALALALLAIVAGFTAAPVMELLDAGPPFAAAAETMQERLP